jgi:DNA-binding CsgD family transcriptional regulator
MTTRGQPSWQQMLGVVHALFAVDTSEQFGHRVLEELEGLVSFDQASFNEVDTSAGRATFVARPDYIDMHGPEVAAWQRLAYQNPILDYQQRTGDGAAKRISDFISLEELHELELYREVYRSLRVEYQVAIGIPCPRPVVIGIALNRSSSDFTDAEVAALDVLRAHIAQAYRIIEIRTNERAAIERLEGILSDEGRLVVVMDDERPVRPITGQARDLLERHFGPFPVQGLPQQLVTWLTDERTAFRRGGPTRLRQPLVTKADDSQLTARLVPASSSSSSEVIVIDERLASYEPSRLIAFGLTRRESEVLWWVSRGKTNEEIAGTLKISAGTVRKHLERVYRSLGVSNRAAAVAKAADALA